MLGTVGLVELVQRILPASDLAIHEFYHHWRAGCQFGIVRGDDQRHVPFHTQRA